MGGQTRKKKGKENKREISGRETKNKSFQPICWTKADAGLHHDGCL